LIGGIGIALSVSKKMIELMGGTLIFASNSQGLLSRANGMTFYLRLSAVPSVHFV
jgi:signal transduction histidine kinase